MRISALCTAVVTYVVIGHPLSAVAQVDQQRAQEYFKEAQALCERDGGRLWGVSLCAPLVIADPRTHTLATSQPAPAHLGHGCRTGAVVRAVSWERREVEPSLAQFDHQRHQRRRAAYKSHFELCRNCVRSPRNSPTTRGALLPTDDRNVDRNLSSDTPPTIF